MVAAPRFIIGSITLGTLMQTAQAFQQMASALSWPIDNLQKVAEWRASVERVIKLQDALGKLGNGHSPEGAGIAILHAPGANMVFDNLSIDTPTGDAILHEFNASVSKGERVLINGENIITTTAVMIHLCFRPDLTPTAICTSITVARGLISDLICRAGRKSFLATNINIVRANVLTVTNLSAVLP